MRITQSSLVNQFIQRIKDNYERLADLQNQVSTGLRVSKPSDDPISASKISSYQAQLKQVDHFQKNTGSARERLGRIDEVYGDVRERLREARQIALAGANDPSNDPKDALSLQVNTIIGNILDLANTKLNGDYLFSGSTTDTKAFTASSESDPVSFTYNGNTYTLDTEVSFSRFMEQTQTGLAAFGYFAHTVVGGKAIENPDAPLNVALGTSFGGVMSFDVNMGGAVNATTVNIDPRTDSLNDLVTAINAANTGVTASLNADHQLVFTSDVEGEAGKMTLTDGSANGILTALEVADSNGSFTGLEQQPDNIFVSLTDLKKALRSAAFKEDKLVNLEDGLGNNLGLQVGDVIQLTSQVAAGALVGPVNFTVKADSTLDDLATFLQTQLRQGGTPDGSETALVRIQQGKLEIVNPKGTNARDFTTITLQAFDSTITTPRANFNTVMSVLGTPAVGASTTSQEIQTPAPAPNIANRIDDLDTLISAVEDNQLLTGGKLKELELLDSRHLDFKTRTETLLSSERDIDIAGAILQLQQAEQVFQAALGAGARLIQPTLLDFLR